MRSFKGHSRTKELHSKIETMRQKYPGVNKFFYTASKWAEVVSPNEDQELYELLYKYRKKKSILDLSDADARYIYQFIRIRDLHDIESFEHMFMDAKGNSGGFKRIVGFNDFDYIGYDVENMKKYDSELRKMARAVIHFTTREDVVDSVTTLSKWAVGLWVVLNAIYSIFGRRPDKKDIKKMKQYSDKMEDLKLHGIDKDNVEDTVSDLSDIIEWLLSVVGKIANRRKLTNIMDKFK